MNTTIGVFSIILATILFFLPMLPPQDSPDRVIEVWKLVALLLIAAAICFHG